MAAVAVAVALTACSDGADERARPGPEPTSRATTTFETLPPVGSYLYPTDPDVVIAQITVAGRTLPLALPLLTIYGDGRTVSVDGSEWIEGNLSEIEVQEFFGEADAVGLLDEPLELRGPAGGDTPDVSVRLAVDGVELHHVLDLSEIERPVALRSFLVQSSSFNEFELVKPFEPVAWISCPDDSCTTSTEQIDTGDRPVLPHEDTESVLAAAVDGGS